MVYNLLLIIYLIGCFVGLWFLFKKTGIAPWKALVPIYNIVLWIQLCNRKWGWYILFLIPAINIYMFLLLVVETAKCFHRYSFWEQTFAVIFPWIYLPIAGLNGWQFHDPKTEPPHKVSEARDWLDAIVFALVAAVIIRGNVLEFYNIPSSSMEKSLMTGDYLLVSKMAYGPRATMTPLALPLVHNVMPFSGGQTESFLRWLKLPYHRYPGFGKVQRYDAVVFNYPDGDTVCTAWQSNRSYHDLVREMGRENVLGATQMMVNGQMVENHIRIRPVDKRENFIKRCIGLPGETLQIVNQQVLIDGKPLTAPHESQQTYSVRFQEGLNVQKILDNLGVSREDYENALALIMYGLAENYEIPLTKEMASQLESSPAVASVSPVLNPDGDNHEKLFPHAVGYDWTVDNYGPIHIPAKGETLQLSLQNLPLYERLIQVYEGNELQVADGIIYINGQATSQYTCRMDYYWMMGDNRHNSADSRYWGFVPEDHIAGKASMVIFSKDKDHGGIRWGRFFLNASRF